MTSPPPGPSRGRNSFECHHFSPAQHRLARGHAPCCYWRAKSSATKQFKDEMPTSKEIQPPHLSDVDAAVTPAGVDRRALMMRSAMIGAVSVLSGCAPSTPDATAQAAATAKSPSLPIQLTPPLSEELNVVKKSKGPVMTTIDEFYKVGPGPSSSHTIGPMRITYDFYQRAAKLPPEQTA